MPIRRTRYLARARGASDLGYHNPADLGSSPQCQSAYRSVDLARDWRTFQPAYPRAAPGVAATAGAPAAGCDPDRVHAARRSRRGVPRVLSGCGLTAGVGAGARCSLSAPRAHAPLRWGSGHTRHPTPPGMRVLSGRRHRIRVAALRRAGGAGIAAAGCTRHFAHRPPDHPARTVIARSAHPQLNSDGLAAHRPPARCVTSGICG